MHRNAGDILKLSNKAGIKLLNKPIVGLTSRIIIKQRLKLVIQILKYSISIILILFSFGPLAHPNLKVLNICVDPQWMPFEGMINNKHTGIASDYLQIFSELTPYSFDIKTTSSWHKSIERLQLGTCDLTLLINSSAEREKYLAFTMPYFFGPNVLVSSKDLPFMQDLTAIGDMTLAVVSGYRLLEEIPLYYPDIKIKVVSSEKEGLIAVEQGEVDLYVGSLYSISLNINQLNLSSLKINGWISLQDKLRIGFTKHNAHLIPIFNQAIEKITSKQHNEILNRWSNAQIVKQTDYTLFYYLAAIMSLIFLIFSWRYLVSIKVLVALNDKNQELEQIRQELLNANKNLEYLSFHDNLTQLYNRHYFMSTLNDHFSHVLRQKGTSAILMIDLDYFKKINDEYGHVVGDKILQQFSLILSKALRAGDIAARWGGEEFIVLLPKANKEQSMFMAQRLIEAVEKYSFESNIRLTISVGVSQYKANDNIESWIERADTALYQAKNEGRNCIKASI
jgi:diguanylate cyclase (GGDEF)-like protein